MSNLRFRTKLVISLAVAGATAYLTFKDITPVSEKLTAEKATAEMFLADLEQKRSVAMAQFASRGGASKPDYWIARSIVDKTLTDREHANIDAHQKCSSLARGSVSNEIIRSVRERAKVRNPVEIRIEHVGQQMSDALYARECPYSDAALASAEQVYNDYLRRVSTQEAAIQHEEVNQQAAISAFNRDYNRYTGEMLAAAAVSVLTGLLAFFILNPLIRLLSGNRTDDAFDRLGTFVAREIVGSSEVTHIQPGRTRFSNKSALAGIVTTGDAGVISIGSRARFRPHGAKAHIPLGEEEVAPPGEEAARSAMALANSEITTARNAGKDVTDAKRKLEEADTAFSQDNYTRAEELAKEAAELARSAKKPPRELALSAIASADSAIAVATKANKDVTDAKRKLEGARVAFSQETYLFAEKLANDAADLARSAKRLPREIRDVKTPRERGLGTLSEMFGERLPRVVTLIDTIDPSIIEDIGRSSRPRDTARIRLTTHLDELQPKVGKWFTDALGGAHS